MEGKPYIHRMAKQAEQDQVTRAARRAVLIDGIPVVTLGVIALTLGSNPDQSTTQKAWWIAITTVFTLAMAWVLLRAFRRADEYLRRIQLESMAIAFAAVLVALQVATLLDAAGIIQLHQLAQLILLGGVAIWLLIADLRTRFHR
jgi:positive regulator of sigma E activity